MLLNDYAAAIAPLMLKEGKHIPIEVVGLGLCGETQELFDVVTQYFDAVRIGGFDYEEARRLLNEAKKEAGDVLWYVVALASVLNIDIASVDIDGAPKGELLGLITGKVADKIKKTVWHGKRYSGFEAQLDVCKLLGALREYCSKVLKASLEDISDINVKKLSARYPGMNFVEGGGVRS